MVIKYFGVVISLLLSLASLASEPLSADDLRKRMMSSESEKKSSADRLKLLRGNRTQVGSVDETTLFYDLPDGRKVRAILLPNGRKSPAITDNGGLKPACVATSGLLVPGEFNASTGKISCALSSADIAYIDDTIYGGADDAPATNSSSDSTSASTISKYSTPGVAGSSAGHKKTGTQKKQPPTQKQSSGNQHVEVRRDPNVYMPQIGSESVKAKTTSFTLVSEKPYGIKRGAWGEVRLERQVSSADSGWVEYMLEADVVGQWQTIPAGSVFFGSKQINTQNRKLESKVNLVRLPDGTEVKMSGWVYSMNRTAGLSGRLERDREGENSTAAGNAALAGLGAAANQVAGPGGVAGTVVDSYTGDMISNERRYSSQAPKATIHVSPQRALIQFAEPL